MTVVRTRLALDRLRPGERLEVLLDGDEPRQGVAPAMRLLGHEVTQHDGADGTTRLVIRKAPSPS